MTPAFQVSTRSGGGGRLNQGHGAGNRRGQPRGTSRACVRKPPVSEKGIVSEILVQRVLGGPQRELCTFARVMKRGSGDVLPHSGCTLLRRSRHHHAHRVILCQMRT